MTTLSTGFSKHLTRRDLLIGGVAAALCGRGATPAFAAAAQPATPVSFKVPRGACDCHTHVFCDPHRFAFWSGRTYTPETATVNETRALHRALHVERIVLVNSLVYGTDNSCMVDALRQLGHRARGIALIDEHTFRTDCPQLGNKRDAVHKRGSGNLIHYGAFGAESF